MKFSDRPKPCRPGALFCPNCGEASTQTSTQYGRRDDCYTCGLWSWDGKRLVDWQTHDARQAAHAVFDRLWKGPTAITTRGGAYRCLRQELGIDRDDCHMAIMTAETARRVPSAVARIRENGPKYYGATRGSGQSKRSMRYPRELDDKVVRTTFCERCEAPAGEPCRYLGQGLPLSIRPHRARWGKFNANRHQETLNA